MPQAIENASDASGSALVSRSLFESVAANALRLAQYNMTRFDGESEVWREAMQAIGAALMLVPLDTPSSDAVDSVQETIPGPDGAPLWSVPLTVDATLSATIFARGKTAEEAKRNAQEFASGEGQALFAFDDGNYRGPSDYYAGDSDAIERVKSAAKRKASEGVDVGAADSGVRKSTFLVTVLHTEGETDGLLGAQLGRIAEEIDEGNWLGLKSHLLTEVVCNRDLLSAQQSVGNDGSFFDGFVN